MGITSVTTRPIEAWDEISRNRERFTAWVENDLQHTELCRRPQAENRLKRAGGVPVNAQYSDDETMTVAAARMLRNGAVCFVGIGLPSTAANLARLTHAPDVVLIYESGPICAKPPVLPLSIGDGNLAETADTWRVQRRRSSATGCRAGASMWDFSALRN